MPEGRCRYSSRLGHVKCHPVRGCITFDWPTSLATKATRKRRGPALPVPPRLPVATPPSEGRAPQAGPRRRTWRCKGSIHCNVICAPLRRTAAEGALPLPSSTHLLALSARRYRCMGLSALAALIRQCDRRTNAARSLRHICSYPMRADATTSRRAPTAAADDPRRDGNP